MNDSSDRLKNGVVLAELGGYGDGPYCAKHGAGAALVLLGTYIVDAGDSVPYDPAFVFKPGRDSYADYLQEHVAAARAGGAAVGVSVISVNLADTVDFLLAAEEAGADYLSLCMHSVMDMFIGVGLGAALLRRGNRSLMREHLSACLNALKRPFIPKIGIGRAQDDREAVAEMVSAGVKLIHANVGNAPGAGGSDVIAELKGHGAFLIAGGGIKTIEDARQVIDTGADAVAIGTAAMQDPGLCGRVQSALRGVRPV